MQARSLIIQLDEERSMLLMAIYYIVQRFETFSNNNVKQCVNHNNRLNCCSSGDHRYRGRDGHICYVIMLSILDILNSERTCETQACNKTRERILWFTV